MTVRATQLCISAVVMQPLCGSGFKVVIERADETVEVTVLVTVVATQPCISAVVMQHLCCVEF